MIINIQILRALAAIIVIFVHAQDWVIKNGFSYGDYENLTFNVRYWGNVGVDLFFVISGYIMFMINSKKQRDSLDFLINRILRIVPIYWLLTFCIFILYLILPSLFRATTYGVEQVLTSLFFISHFWGYEVPALYVGWTLEYEVFFYVLFSLTLLFRINNIYRLLILLIIFSISVYFSWYSSIAFDFLYGGVIFIMFDKFKWLKNYKNNFFWVLIILAFAYIFYHAHIDQSDRYIYWGIPSAIILFSSLMIKEIKSVVLSQLGDASYSIYLMQVFTLPAMTKVLVKLTPNMPGILVFLIISIFSIFVGYLFYWLIERNLNLLVKKCYKS